MKKTHRAPDLNTFFYLMGEERWYSGVGFVKFNFIIMSYISVLIIKHLSKY